MKKNDDFCLKKEAQNYFVHIPYQILMTFPLYMSRINVCGKNYHV